MRTFQVVQWIDKDILKYGEAQDSLWCYLNKLNTQSNTNKKNKKGRYIKYYFHVPLLSEYVICFLFFKLEFRLPKLL